ncbi:MAG: LysR family transcriptional regulator [Capsulimonadaceae bacterium]|nr:LysR family transcriptional regulator [Capsulimonadaceae bacterium]
MNINHLAIFHAVLQEGSVSLGAERLHISQPAVSKQLKEFEESLNTKLFDRHPKGVRPTEAGELLGGYARRLFALEAEAELALAEMQGLQRGRLVIGASLTIGNYLLPEILSRFHVRYPGVEVNVEIGNTEVIQGKLIDGALDLGFTEGYVEIAELDAAVFGEDELVPIAAPEHSIFATRPVTLEALCREDFVLREQGSGTREVMERALAARGFTLRSVMTFGDIEACKRAVAAGIGIGIVSAHTIAMELALGKVERIEVADFAIRRPLHLLTLRGKYQTRAARALLALLRQPIHGVAPG